MYDESVDLVTNPESEPAALLERREIMCERHMARVPGARAAQLQEHGEW
jgi:hypothetical protein